MLDRAALVGSLDEYADCLSDPTAPKHRLNLGASITGLLAVAEFYRDALSHDHIMVFELFIISQLQAEQSGGGPVDAAATAPVARVLRGKPALQVAHTWLRSVFRHGRSGLPEEFLAALFRRCLDALAAAADSVAAAPSTPTKPAPSGRKKDSGGAGKAGAGAAATPPDTALVLVALAALEAVLALRPALSAEVLAAAGPLGASLRRVPGAAPELELALLPLLMCHGPAVPRAVNPGPSISSFLQASLPHAWSDGTVALRTFEVLRRHADAIERHCPRALARCFPLLLKMAAWHPHLVGDDLLLLLPCLMTEETVVGLHAALLDMPFLVMALERSLPCAPLPGCPNPHEAPEAGASAWGPGDPRGAEVKGSWGAGTWGLISGLALGGGGGHGGGDAGATGSGSSAAQQAQAYLEALAGCNSAAEYRRCAPRAPPVGGFLGGVAAKGAPSPAMAHVCGSLAPGALRAFYTCLLRDASDSVMASVLESLLRRQNTLFALPSFEARVGRLARDVMTSIVRRVPQALQALHDDIARVVEVAMEGDEKMQALGAHLIWMLGEFLPLGGPDTPPCSSRVRGPSSAGAPASGGVTDGALDFVETLEAAVFSALASRLATQQQLPGDLMAWGPAREAASPADHLAGMALTSLAKLAARSAALAPRAQLVLGKVVAARGCCPALRQRAAECLGLLREPSVAAAVLLRGATMNAPLPGTERLEYTACS